MSAFAIVLSMTLSNRQRQLMISLLTGSASLPQLVRLPSFAEVTERTLQRDLNDLSYGKRSLPLRTTRYSPEHGAAVRGCTTRAARSSDTPQPPGSSPHTTAGTPAQ